MAGNLQVYSCRFKDRRGKSKSALASAPQCLVCSGPRTIGEFCRFKGFRSIFVQEDGSVTTSFSVAPKTFSPIYPDCFNARPSLETVEQLRSQMAPLMLPLLERLQAHDATSGLIRKHPEIDYRVQCDVCRTSIFFDSFFCTDCGLEICHRCREWPHPFRVPVCPSSDDPPRHHYRPLSRLAPGEADNALASARRVITDHPYGGPPPVNQISQLLSLNAQHHRKVPKIRPGQFEVFKTLWSMQLPVVVTGVEKTLQGTWTPESFGDSYGQEEVLMIDSSMEHPKKVTAEAFFKEFKRDHADRGNVIALKDWPSSASFADKMKVHHRAFTNGVPMPSYTRSDGVLNLVAHYPEPLCSGASNADIGPKLYNATPDVAGAGTTKLHLDVTSAVNILVYTSGGTPGAKWHIFMASDSAKLRSYLCSKSVCLPGEDPIHAQQTYVTPPMLDELAAQGVRPFEIQQELGQAVFIPAGCPHQVSNTSACIKIACDFLCAEGVEESMKMAEELRLASRPDVLGLDAMLWHAWVSMQVNIEKLRALPKDETDRRQRHNQKQRNTKRGREDRIRRRRERSNPGGAPSSSSSSSTPSKGSLRCPYPGCLRRARLFCDAEAVLKHVSASHQVTVDRLEWPRFEALNQAQFEALLYEVVDAR